MFMKTLSRDQLSQILKSAIEIRAEEMVVVKVDLGIPSERLKKMAR